MSSSAVCNYKRGLRDKGFIDTELGIPHLTDKARRRLVKLHEVVDSAIVMPRQVYIPVWGQVRAGRAKHDEMAVYMTDPSDEDIPTIAVPEIARTDVFALEVVGQSMEHEHIYDQDYVFVQPFSDSEWPKQGEMIVTKYLALRDEEYVDWDVGIDEEWLEGPTAKFYFEKEDIYRLSVRRDFNASPYTIQTKHILPIGRVISVYKPMRF